MTESRLWIESAPKEFGGHDFVWRSKDKSSIRTNISPTLSSFGRVAERNREAVWLAIAIFITDRTVTRRKGWQRTLNVNIPVLQEDTWSAVVRDIEESLSFLTSDFWDLDFVDQDTLDVGVRADRPPGDPVCLFSGGADSLCGAIKALDEGKSPILLSHWDWAGHARSQSRMAEELSAQFDIEVSHIQVRLGRRGKQLDGTSFPDEPSRRSRSLLFITLGLAVASVAPSLPLWIPENGFMSINAPLASERRASLSTRTTHPRFFEKTQAYLTAVGAHTDFENPFTTSTKGEIFEEVAGIVGSSDASRILSKTHSCTHVRRAMEFGYPPATHCGVCLGCVVRRAAFLQADIDDRTTYLVNELSGARRERFFSHGNVGSEVETVRYACERGISEADVLAIELPENSNLDETLSLIRRGFSELSKVPLP